MPQMAPINWMWLYLFFSMLFMTMCVLNFFSFKYYPKYMLNKNKLVIKSWKW
uniref:ATP synthase complex subunit 8 n=1 Tax=Anisandrus dispar TaxID=748732 RepID=A0A343A6L3_9CUCU|nr:ATP synthase F0 subunit 8 [Anisandrus dispar]AOY40218.1 ATP synthase F0 subunit 8 [Anisandrus dispar]